MPSITFKVSDSQKYDFIWSLLNTNYNEEGNWSVEYSICEIYDEYAIVRNHAESIYERVYYTKNDETDSLEITKKEQCFIVDVNEAEKKALTILHGMNNGTYELVDERLTNAESSVATLTEENSTFSTKIGELNDSIATLNTEKADVDALYTAATDKIASMETEYSAAQATIASLTEERDALATFKKNTIDEQKKAIIANYASVLDQAIIDTYTEGMDNYTLEQLDMRLTYEQKKAHPEVFSKNAPAAYIPKEETPKGGIESLLLKYEKKH
jgi:chromosome segregation ATPase